MDASWGHRWTKTCWHLWCSLWYQWKPQSSFNFFGLWESLWLREPHNCGRPVFSAWVEPPNLSSFNENMESPPPPNRIRYGWFRTAPQRRTRGDSSLWKTTRQGGKTGLRIHKKPFMPSLKQILVLEGGCLFMVQFRVRRRCLRCCSRVRSALLPLLLALVTWLN